MGVFTAGAPSTITVSGGPNVPASDRYVLGTPNPDIVAWIPPGVTGLGFENSQCKMLWVAKCDNNNIATFNPPVGSAGLVLYFRSVIFDKTQPDGFVTSQVRTAKVAPPAPPPPTDNPDLTTGIPLQAHDLTNVARQYDLFQCGVPFAASVQLTSVAGLAVVDGAGTSVPTQFRVMQRWGNLLDAAAPIAWLLVEFRGDCAAGAQATYYLKKAVANPSPQVSVTKTADGYLVDTGAALFELSSKANHFFENVYIDLNGNGSYESNERVSAAAAGTGSQLLAADGVVYSSEYDAPKITYLTARSGPAATRFKIEGRHRAASSTAGAGRDVLKYSTYLEFARNSAEVRAIHTMRNDYYMDPIGPVCVKNYEVAIKFDTASDPNATVTAYGDSSLSPFKGTIASLQKLEVYQDSSGGPNWTLTPGTTFKGYKMLAGTASPNTVATGARAAGIIDLSNSNCGLTVAGRYFWQTFPKSLEVSSSGRMSVKMIPSNFAGPEWLDDSQNQTTEFLLAFHKGSSPAYASARAFQRPVRPCAPSAYIQKTKAWPDHGDLPVPLDDPAAVLQLAINYRSQTDTGHDLYDNWGWQAFGEEKWYQSTHTTGSPRNVLTAFPRFAETGRLEFFEVPEEGALHGASVRTFHIDGFVAADHPNAYIYEGVPYPNLSAFPDDLNRSSVANQYASLKQQIPAAGWGWNGFDEEHMTIDDIYEYTLLTGHPLAEESVRQVADEILTFPFIKTPGTKPLTTRACAWCERALLKAWFITGASRYLDGATTLVKNLNQYRGIAPNAWATSMIDYGKAFPGNFTDTYESPWQMGPLLHSLVLYYRTTGDALAKTMMKEMADYLCDPAWGPNGNFKRFIKNKDIDQWVICTQYDGVGQWIPSALAAVNRVVPNPIYLAKAQAQYNFTYGQNGPTWKLSMVDPLWHWWLVYFAEKQGGNLP
ncbi:MAG: hypothetical protein HY286_09930 [Planctomycetes bacterium]|nr:hypothetical protein [Planctomycetota bacterium]